LGKFVLDGVKNNNMANKKSKKRAMRSVRSGVKKAELLKQNQIVLSKCSSK
jgi:hypothetical protein